MAKYNSKKSRFNLIGLGVLALALLVLTQIIDSRQAVFNRSSAAPNDIVAGVGIMGDSNSDEYRANDDRGGAYRATTHNWVEQLQKYRNINFGEWGNWGGSRRTGYKFNWAKSGATSSSLLSEGQHTGLLQQINSGEVTAVFLAIGVNDYAYYYDTYRRIYNGTLTGSGLDNYINMVANNVITAMDTVRQPNKAKILVATVPDTGKTSPAIREFPNAAGRQRVSSAIAQTNQKIADAVASRGLALFDTDAILLKLLGRVDAQGYTTVAGEKISFVDTDDEPHHAILGDDIHAGTVFSGIYANEWMDAMNKQLGTQLQLFTEEELLIHAGIRQPATTPRTSATPRATATPRITPTPTVQATVRPTASPRLSPTPRVTPTASVAPQPQYCSFYKRYRSILVRFISSSSRSYWDSRCGI